MTNTKTALWLVAALALPQAALAQTGREVMDKADKQNRAQDEVVSSTMEIISASGQKRVNKLTAHLLAKEGDDDLSLVRFTAPASMSGTGLLTVEKGGEDEQWLYLPDLKKSKRIAGETKAASFVGSDFSNYDMRTEDLANHEYELVGEEEVAGSACFKVEAKPKNDDAAEMTGYSRRLFWVDKARYVVHKVEYFDRSGKPLKTLVATEYKEVKGLWRAHRVEVTNQQEGTKTIMQHAGERKIN